MSKHIGMIVMLVILPLLIGVAHFAMRASDETAERKWQAFRAECEQDRKPYECQAIWSIMRVRYR